MTCKFRDAHMQGVLLEDHRSLKFYGLIDKVESNLFLARTNPLKNEIAELLLIDADGVPVVPRREVTLTENKGVSRAIKDWDGWWDHKAMMQPPADKPIGSSTGGVSDLDDDEPMMDKRPHKDNRLAEAALFGPPR